METNYTNQSDFNLEKLISGLKHEDDRNHRLTKIMQGIMWAFTPLYFLFFLVDILFRGVSLKHFEFLLFALGFLSFALIFRYLSKDYKLVDYGVPTVEMLTKAARRYKFFQKKSLLIIVPVLFMSTALSFGMQEVIPHPDMFIRILIVQVIYVFVTFLAVLVGYFIWRVRQKPLRDKALELLNEIEG